jgi:hypothetical protein
MSRTRRAQRQSPPCRYKVPMLRDPRQRMILKAFLPPGCKRACRTVIDVAFKRLQTVLTGGRYIPNEPRIVHRETKG